MYEQTVRLTYISNGTTETEDCGNASCLWKIVPSSEKHHRMGPLQKDMEYVPVIETLTNIKVNDSQQHEAMEAILEHR